MSPFLKGHMSVLLGSELGLHVVGANPNQDSCVDISHV